MNPTNFKTFDLLESNTFKIIKGNADKTEVTIEIKVL